MFLLRPRREESSSRGSLLKGLSLILMTTDGMISKLKSKARDRIAKISIHTRNLTLEGSESVKIVSKYSLILTPIVALVAGFHENVDILDGALICSMGSFLFGNSTRQKKSKSSESIAEEQGRGIEKSDSVDQSSTFSPGINWRLFADMSLPGENASYSLHDGNGKFLDAAANCESVWGQNLRSLLDQSISELAGDDKSINEWLISLDGEQKTEVYSIKTSDKRSLDLKKIPLFISNDQNKTQIVVKAAPQSGYKKQEALQKTLGFESTLTDVDLLEVSIELIHESVVILKKTDQAYQICFVNQAFQEMTGLGSTQVAGKSLSCLKGPDTSAESFKHLESAIDLEEEAETELILYREDGAKFWSKTRVCPLRDTTGKADYFVAILEDSTELKSYAEELASKNSELEEALENLKQTQRAVIQQENLRAIGQMASGIAHDFNNLLAPILGFSELLLNVAPEDRDEEKLKSYLEKIQVAAQDGAAVVSRLRELYRSQNNTEEYVKIKPEELVWQVKELTKHRWKNQAEAAGITIEFETNVNSHRCIKANESEIRQVLTNLVINAVDAISEDGKISINVEDHGENLRISVCDTGSGMPKDAQKNCLEPFYTTKGKLGTGLGLSIVVGVVKRHNGEFKIESEEGKGTNITIDFPALEPDREDEANENEASFSNSLKIMLVDDEEVLLEVISELLGNGGHDVEKFSNPKAALEAFGKNSYDLVITDRAMPGMSGDQLAAEIKAFNSNTPVYMVTGFGDVIKESGEKLSNIDEVLGKPVPLDVLNKKISELVSGRN